MSEIPTKHASHWEERVPRVTWIEDEGLLRDEGTVHGLLGLSTETEQKMKAISSFFDEKAEHLQRAYSLINDELEALQEKKKSLLEEKTTLSSERSELTARDADDEIERHSAGRYVLGFLLAVAICITNWWLLHGFIPQSVEDTGIVAAAVLLTGFFCMFEPKSLLYVADDTRADRRAELWKVRLLEFGMPLTTAALIVVWGVPAGEWPLGIALGVYLFMLFLFCGKLLLTTVPQIGLIGSRVAAKWHARRRRKEIDSELERIRNEREPALEQEMAQVQVAKSELPSMEAVKHEKARAQAVFQSEVDLARTALQMGEVTQDEVEDILKGERGEHA